MPPIFGGRLWTSVSTWSLMIPAVGIGLAVQSPDTPYIFFLALSLLCGFGGGNFASSMANISFFFRKAEKGNALALNAGLGNLGVSVVQIVIPLVNTAGVFGWFGGDPLVASDGTRLWLQNAGFIWVPFIALSATGWLSDRYGGARVTFWVFTMMIMAVGGVLYFLGIKDQPGAFWGFFAMFMVLFFATGVGNASTFQMIPAIMRAELIRLEPGMSIDVRQRQAEMESAAIIGFTSAVAAYGAFFIPKAYGTSILVSGGPELALWGFMAFYVICIAITWGFYTRRGGLLRNIERGDSLPPTSMQPAE
jgi:nitrate/nitrite transporter NarK